MQKILIISFSKIKTDPRVRRQLSLLKDDFELVVAGFGPLQIPGISMVSLPEEKQSFIHKAIKAMHLLSGAFLQYYWSIPAVKAGSQAFASANFDLVIANDVDALPLALKVAKGAAVILDAHEYSPREFENWKWRLFFQRYKSWLCHNYISQANSVCTVCHGIAEEYRRNFGVECSVVMNAAEYRDLQPSDVSDDRIRLIHHGGAIRERRIELMIDMMSFLDQRFILDLMLVRNDVKYYEELRKRIGHNPRIRLVDPVPLEEIPVALNRYDLGVFILPFTNLNYMYALPNKFFEFVQGRLGIAIGPSPEMAALVQKHDLGLIAEDFSPASLARLLNNLTANQVRRFKANAHQAARELSWETASQQFKQMVWEVLKKTS